MKTTIQKTLSKVVTTPKTRTTRQTLHILQFIHRFRHVTARHIQLSLQHTTVTATHNILRQLCAKGYIDRRYGPKDRAANQEASYFLTPEGLGLLQERYPEWKFRQLRSVRFDADMSLKYRKRCHTLASVYVHFKRHYDGHFEFWSAFDIAALDHMPDETPDGYVRVTLPRKPMQHYLVEIHGWGRTTQLQRRRLLGYMQYAESERWQQKHGGSAPSLFVVAGSTASQNRLGKELADMLKACMASDFKVFTASAAKLDSEESAIWRKT